MSSAQISRSRRRLASAVGRVERKPFAVVFMYVMWAVTIFDLHRWLGSVGASILQRSQAFLFYGLIVLLAISAPKLLSRLKAENLVAPLLFYVAVAVVALPFAESFKAARNITQMLLLYYLLVIATVNFVRTPRQALPILLMFPLQYFWWAIHARASGQVEWHSIYANFDGFGPLAVMGMGLCFYFALSAKSKAFKWLNFILAGYCVVGVVASFARGAVLAAGLVVFIIWLRSPRKMLTASAVLLAVAILLVASNALFPGKFWPEISSAFTEGTQEGTGRDRWELWKAALKVWLTQPVIGVGPGQFGPNAAQMFGAGQLYGYENPAHLYDRNLHSIFVQIFTEFGILGTAAFIWILVDFWKRNRSLQNSEASLAWALATGGRFELRYILIALEVAMTGYLATGFFYAQLYNHWFYTLIAVNAMLCMAVKPEYDRLRRMRMGSRPSPAGGVGVSRASTPRRGPTRAGLHRRPAWDRPSPLSGR